MNNFSKSGSFLFGAQKIYFDSSSKKGVVFYYFLFVCFKFLFFQMHLNVIYTHTNYIQLHTLTLYRTNDFCKAEDLFLAALNLKDVLFQVLLPAKEKSQTWTTSLWQGE